MRILTRRQFAVALGSAAAWPIAARGQQVGLPVLGILGSGTEEGISDRLAAVMQGLKEAGFVVGQNVAVDSHWAEGRYEKLSDLAADLIRHQVAIIVAASGPAAIAAKRIGAVIHVGGGEEATGIALAAKPVARG